MRAAVCLLATLLVGCGGGSNITGVHVILVHAGAPRFDQFEVHLDLDGVMFPPTTVPPTPGALLASPQDLFIYVPDDWADKTAFCRARGLRFDGQTQTSNGLANSVPTPVTILRHRVVSCVINLDLFMDGGVLDAAPVPLAEAGMPAPDARIEAALPSDGAELDAPPTTPDAPPPGADVPPPPDTVVPADAAAPDGPAADAPPISPDLPGDPPPLPPDAMAPVTGCAANGDRKAFIDPGKFPDVAACGAPVSYSAAIGAAACAPGWHWCKAEEVGSLPAAEPGAVSGSTCGWIDGTQGTCSDRRSSYNQAGCAGSAARNLSVGGPTSGALPCTGIDLACGEPWKLAISFDRWATSSVSRMSGGCLEHLGFQCTSSAGGASCWVTCCKD